MTQEVTLQLCILFQHLVVEIYLSFLSTEKSPGYFDLFPDSTRKREYRVDHRIRHGKGIGCNKRLRWLVLGLDHYLKGARVGTCRKRDLAHCANDGIVSPTSLCDLQFCLSVWAEKNLAFLVPKSAPVILISVPVVPSLTTSSVGGSGMPPVSPKLSPYSSPLFISMFSEYPKIYALK